MILLAAVLINFFICFGLNIFADQHVFIEGQRGACKGLAGQHALRLTCS